MTSRVRNGSGSSSRSGTGNSTSSLSCVLVGLVILLALTTGAAEARPPPLCTQQKVALSPQTRDLCKIFANIARFSQDIEDYLDAKVLSGDLGVSEPEVKRQDIDHVFLRFGRTQQ
ncbi:neuropeptide receptor myosuppressin [Oratosquilla oratoria]|uniref:neuropeptide receptor myosuppressin n=1 Tax=Oratosquilla oratoria TaxID=337810 RepID=UPI003F75AF43